MNKKYIFCEECRNEVLYTIKEELMTDTIKGTEYSYNGKKAYCSDCGSLVYVPEINDYNLKALYDVYRIANNIISLEDILIIPKKYSIGKRPLSLLLGWGEQTFSRYADGDMPTKQYSDILKKILDDPNYYLEILENGKSNLKSTLSYEKSKEAVTKILNLKTGSINKSRISIAIEYILYKCEDITPLALQKALYYIQGFFCAFYDEYIFSEECEAWVHGPVFKDVYIKYRDYHFDSIESCDSFDDSELTTQEKVIYDNVIKYFCCYSGKILEYFTHNEKPWISARGNLPPSASSNKIITKESINEYFSEIKEKYHMIVPNDMRLYAHEIFNSL
ncbi:type II TA system antitoxin MqsA family protein [Ruminococcus flavefaciens]|uniref:type II TA system antitoxin MqsA family protein n=1 Tax=Ruminococcus flavefaciens TaxID=1265 RepID=UPI0002D9E5DE|nr:type II TA system antitoxin MqsA family protein [Ruminococcus flavefaciens]